jgi:ribonuclease HI
LKPCRIKLTFLIGGVILDPKGNTKNTFEWGLGKATNNQAEAFALFQGLRIIDNKHIRNIIVIGDLTLIINLMLKVTPPSNGTLIRIITPNQARSCQVQSVEFYHVLRMLNHQANNLANKAKSIGMWKNKVKRRGGILPYPLSYIPLNFIMSPCMSSTWHKIWWGWTYSIVGRPKCIHCAVPSHMQTLMRIQPLQPL